MERTSNRTKNTSFSTDPETFRTAKMLATMEDISLSELVDRALRKEIAYLTKRHKHNQQLASLTLQTGEEVAL
jgi:hypothetical protein